MGHLNRGRILFPFPLSFFLFLLFFVRPRKGGGVNIFHRQVFTIKGKGKGERKGRAKRRAFEILCFVSFFMLNALSQFQTPTLDAITMFARIITVMTREGTQFPHCEIDGNARTCTCVYMHACTKRSVIQRSQGSAVQGGAISAILVPRERNNRERARRGRGGEKKRFREARPYARLQEIVPRTIAI